LQIQIRPSNGVPEVAETGDVTRNPAMALYDTSRTLADSIAQFPGAIVSVYAIADQIRGIKVTHRRGTHPATFNSRTYGWTLHDRHRLTEVEAEYFVQRQGPIVKRRLEETHGQNFAFPAAIQHGLHQLSSDAMILDARVDGDRSHTENSITLIQAIASDDSTILLRDHAPEAGMGKHHRKKSDGNGGLRKFRGKPMVGVDLVKGVVANAPRTLERLPDAPSE
jgi:hypothetical protein